MYGAVFYMPRRINFECRLLFSSAIYLRSVKHFIVIPQKWLSEFLFFSAQVVCSWKAANISTFTVSEISNAKKIRNSNDVFLLNIDLKLKTDFQLLTDGQIPLASTFSPFVWNSCVTRNGPCTSPYLEMVT